MTTNELIAMVRRRLVDVVAPAQFQPGDIIAALNDAQNEFAKRTLCLFDGETKANVVGGSPWVTLPTGTIWLLSGRLADGTYIKTVTEHELEYGYFELNGVEAQGRFSNWRSQTGTPKFLCTNSQNGSAGVRLVPYPETSTSIVLDRYRMPVVMTESQGPEIADVYQPDLVFGATAYLYGLPDVEIFNAAQVQIDKAEWASRVENAQGLLQSALRMQHRTMPLPPGVVYGSPNVLPIGPAQISNTEAS